MAALRERWRAGRASFLVFAGAAVAFVGQCAWLAYDFATAPITSWPATLAVFGPGIALAVVTPLALVGGRRTTRRYVLVAVLASVLASLTLPGLVGGGIALVGALAGLLRSHATGAAAS